MANGHRSNNAIRIRYTTEFNSSRKTEKRKKKKNYRLIQLSTGSDLIKRKRLTLRFLCLDLHFMWTHTEN